MVYRTECKRDLSNRADLPSPRTAVSTRGVGEGTGVRGNALMTKYANQEFARWAIPPELEKKMHVLASELRQRSTPSEAVLWQALRNRRLAGRKFRRQEPIGVYVVDFFCSEERLIIEIDGGIHEQQKEADSVRQELIETVGLRFLRFSANEVETNLPAVLHEIRAAFSENSNC